MGLRVKKVVFYLISPNYTGEIWEAPSIFMRNFFLALGKVAHFPHRFTSTKKGTVRLSQHIKNTLSPDSGIAFYLVFAIH